MENQENNQENVNVQENAQGQNTQNQNVDFDGLLKAVQKGMEQKENAVINGYLKSLGLGADEIKVAAAEFKEKRAQEEEAKKSNADELMRELNTVKAELKQAKREKFVSSVGADLGLNNRGIEAALKLGSFEDVEDVETIKTGFNDFLTKYPEFKPTNNNNSQGGKIVEIGSPDGEDVKKVGDSDMLKAFGMTEEEFLKYKRK